MRPILEVRDLSVRYGAIEAVKGVSLEVAEGEMVTVIGANGAGKTSLLQALVGILRPAGGQVLFEGQEITDWPTHRIAALGISLVPEGRRLFPEMTVAENLLVGAHLLPHRREIEAEIEKVFTLFPRLQERRGQVAETMSGGEQQMLAIGRALMARPRLLVLDEPSLGLAPTVIDQITDRLREIHLQDHLAVILVEQNAQMALSLAQRAYVLETGLVVAAGPADEIANSSDVQSAYLGI